MQQTSTTYLSKDTLATHADPHRQKLARQNAYAISKLATALMVVLVVAFQALLGFPIISITLQNWAKSISSDPGFVVGLFAFVAGNIVLLCLAPIDYAVGYTRPKIYGLTSLSHREWWKTYANSYLHRLLKFIAGIEV